MLHKIQYRLQQFMDNRYGMDELNRFFLICSVFFLVIFCIFQKHTLSVLSYSLSITALICLNWRIFSKNVEKRQTENDDFLFYRHRLERKRLMRVRRFKERKINRYFTCRKCGQNIRVPAGKGKICITCPKCHNEFTRRT